MSENNEEIVLARSEYAEANNINVDSLPSELDTQWEAINTMIDEYEADPTDAKFDAIEKTSKELAGKIKAWHEASKKPVEQPKAPEAPKAVEPKQTEPAPVATPKATTPAEADEEEEESNPWDYRNLMN